jgi:hypothetical protein
MCRVVRLLERLERLDAHAVKKFKTGAFKCMEIEHQLMQFTSLGTKHRSCLPPV